MKKIFSILTALFFVVGCNSVDSPTVQKPISFAGILATSAIQLNFTQLSGDWARPMGGAEYWYGEEDLPLSYKPLDGYWRFTWSDNQDLTTGANNFTNIDNQIKNILSIQPGMKFSLGVMTRCSSCSQSISVGGSSMFYPLALHNQMQAESNTKDIATNGVWIQNYNSPSYIAWEKKRNKDLNDHIVAMGWGSQVSYIDDLEYGDYGEFTENDLVIGTNCQPSISSLNSLMDGVMQGFQNQWVTILISAFDGNLQLGNTRVQPEVGEHALQARNNKGVAGWKRMSWGDNSFWNDRWSFANTTTMPDGFRFDTAIQNRYKYAPVVGEPINFQNSSNPGPYDDIDREITSSHASSFGNGNFETNKGNAHGNANMAAAFAKMGNKWTLVNGNITGSALTLYWKNLGLTPTYEDWNVTYELRQSGIVKFSWVSNIKLKLNANLAITDVEDLTAAPAGTYDLDIKIADPTGVRTPYPLGITGRNSDGSYLIAANITLGGVTPIPPTPPANCDTIVTKKDTTYKTHYDTVITKHTDTTFTVRTDTVHRVCPDSVKLISLFPSNSQPVAGVDIDYPGATNIKGIEDGVKFVSSVSGFIKGVKFYKSSGNSGTHIGELYSSAGVKLGAATFVNETATGWQSVNFASPVAVVAGVSYVAAVFNSAGYYTEDNDYFKGKSVSNAPLTAPADGTNGASGKDTGNGQGFYIYTAAPAFPNNLYRSANYWIDVNYSSR